MRRRLQIQSIRTSNLVPHTEMPPASHPPLEGGSNLDCARHENKFGEGSCLQRLWPSPLPEIRSANFDPPSRGGLNGRARPALHASAACAADRAGGARMRWKKISAARATSPPNSPCPTDARASAKLVARKAGTIAGLIAAECAFRLVDPKISFRNEASGRPDRRRGHGARDHRRLCPLHSYRPSAWR